MATKPVRSPGVSAGSAPADSSSSSGSGLDAPERPQAIDVPLRQHGSQPRGQAAATVEVAQQRLARAGGVRQPIQLAVQRVGQFTRAAGGIDRVGRAQERRAIAGDEVLPRRLQTFDARGRQRQVLEVQAAHVFFDRGRVTGHGRVRHAALERGLPQRHD